MIDRNTISKDELMLMLEDLQYDLDNTPWYKFRAREQFKGAYYSVVVLVKWLEMGKPSYIDRFKGEENAEFN